MELALAYLHLAQVLVSVDYAGLARNAKETEGIIAIDIR